MARLCENGHEVREGMFHCLDCGSEDISEGGAHAPRKAADVSVQELRGREAEDRLTAFISRGVSLGLIGLVLEGIALAVAGSADVGDGVGLPILLNLAGAVLLVVGAGYALAGIVGWGVKFGNEATRTD